MSTHYSITVVDSFWQIVTIMSGGMPVGEFMMLRSVPAGPRRTGRARFVYIWGLKE